MHTPYCPATSCFVILTWQNSIPAWLQLSSYSAPATKQLNMAGAKTHNSCWLVSLKFLTSPQGAFVAALESFAMFPSPFTLPHSSVAVSYFFLPPQTSMPPPPSSLSAFDYACYFIEKIETIKRKKRKKNLAPIPITVSTHLPVPRTLPSVLFCGWTTRACISGQPYTCAPIPSSSYQPNNIEGRWIHRLAGTVPGVHDTFTGTFKIIRKVRTSRSKKML